VKVALVTGGARGIGAAIASRLVTEGYAVAIAGRRAPDALPQGQSFLTMDVGDPEQVRAGFATLAARFGRLDALVNNAGLAGTDMLAPDDHALWHAVMATNLHGSYYCAKAALPMLPDGTGRIVTIASVLGLRGVPDQAPYVAAKHGVIGLTRALALAAAPRGITVNAICPGWVDTDMAEARFAALRITRAQAEQGVPTGHMTSPEQVADLVAFLLRPSSGSLTGLALPIDGGSLVLP
jgi:NAD(P)-dependent dehydrogenase (short-subunit alcohol dehydrogenase family)